MPCRGLWYGRWRDRHLQRQVRGRLDGLNARAILLDGDGKEQSGSLARSHRASIGDQHIVGAVYREVAEEAWVEHGREVQASGRVRRGAGVTGIGMRIAETRAIDVEVQRRRGEPERQAGPREGSGVGERELNEATGRVIVPVALKSLGRPKGPPGTVPPKSSTEGVPLPDRPMDQGVR